MTTTLPVSTNTTYGQLTVIDMAPRRVLNGKQVPTEWVCKCECGNTKIIAGSSLRHGLVKTCGCGRSGTKKLVSKAQKKSYAAWAAMKKNCNNKEAPRYPSVGGLGITYPALWNSFEGFYKDIGDAPEGKFFTRRDLKDNYSKSNCVWVDERPQRGKSKNTKEKWSRPFLLDMDSECITDSNGEMVIAINLELTAEIAGQIVEAFNAKI